MTSAFKPLRVDITIKNGSPIREPKHLIHLNALLAYVAVQRSMADGAEDFSAQERLPLDTLTHEDASHPVWAASALFYQPHLKRTALLVEKNKPWRNSESARRWGFKDSRQ